VHRTELLMVRARHDFTLCHSLNGYVNAVHCSILYP
jgi:hypothetical protein